MKVSSLTLDELTGSRETMRDLHMAIHKRECTGADLRIDIHASSCSGIASIVYEGFTLAGDKHIYFFLQEWPMETESFLDPSDIIASGLYNYPSMSVARQRLNAAGIVTESQIESYLRSILSSPDHRILNIIGKEPILFTKPLYRTDGQSVEFYNHKTQSWEKQEGWKPILPFRSQLLRYWRSFRSLMTFRQPCLKGA